MSLIDSVVVNVILGRPGVTAPGFGVPLIASQNAAAVFGGDITRTYATLSDVLEDFAATTPEYNAARAIFSQDLSVSRIRIGKLPTNPVTQRWSISVASAGVDRTYTAKVWLADGTALEASYDTTSASNAGTVISSTNPISILPSPSGVGTWIASIDQGSNQTWTFTATRGHLDSTASPAFSGTDGTITVRTNGLASTDQVITLTSASDTLTKVLLQINAQALNFTAVTTGSNMLLESNRFGDSSQVEILAGTAGTLTDLGLAVGVGTAGTGHCQKTAGTGNKLVHIAFFDAATPAEVAAAIALADGVTGGTLVVNADGFLQLTTSTTGPTPNGVQVKSTGALTLGFDTTEHNGETTGGATNDDIIQGLQDAIEALADLPDITLSQTGSSGSKALQLIANDTDVWFAIEIANPSLLHCVQNQSAPTSSGLATDLTAIANSITDWYGLITLYNSSAYVAAAAAWTETQTKLYVPAVSDTVCATVANSGGTDILHNLKAAGYARTAGFFHPRAAQFADAAEMGYFFPIDPGQDNWRMKTLSGITSGWANGEQFSSTQATNLEDRNANYYADIGGVSVIGGNGVVADGEYIDVVRGLDWFVANLSTNLINLLIQNNKVPFTNAGISQVVGVCRSMVQTGIDEQLIDPGDPPGIPVPTVTAPKKSQVSAANRAARILPDVQIAFVLAGAINKILVTVNVSQ